MKTCKVCQKTKDVSEFSNKKGTKDGLHPHCKECRRNKAKTKYNLTVSEENGVCQTKNTAVSEEKPDILDDDPTPKMNKWLQCRGFDEANPEIVAWYKRHPEKDPKNLRR